MSDVPLPAADPWLEVHLIVDEVRKAITRAREAQDTAHQHALNAAYTRGVEVGQGLQAKVEALKS